MPSTDDEATLEQDLLQDSQASSPAPESADEPTAGQLESGTEPEAATGASEEGVEAADVESHSDGGMAETLRNWAIESYGDDPELGAIARSEAKKFESDDDYFKSLLHAKKLVGQRDEDAQIGKRIRENPQQALQELQSWLGGPTPAPEPPDRGARPETVPSENGFDPYDPKWDRYLETGEDGKLKPKGGAPLGILDEYEQGMARFQSAVVRQANRPEEVVAEAIGRLPDDHPIWDRLVERLVPTMGQVTLQQSKHQKDQQFIEDWKAKNPWLFGDPKNPQGGWSQDGETFVNKYFEKQYQAYLAGKLDIDEALGTAYKAMRFDDMERRKALKAPPTPKKQAEHVPDTAEISPEDYEPPEGETLEQSLLKTMAHSGA